jgi:hypothetical protein
MWRLYHGCNSLAKIELKIKTKIYRDSGRAALASRALLPFIRPENFVRRPSVIAILGYLAHFSVKESLDRQFFFILIDARLWNR